MFQTKETTNGRMLSSKELHEYLEIGRVFNSWIRGRIEKYGFVQGVDYQEVWLDNQTGEILETEDRQSKIANSTYQKDYYITINMAKELSIIENSEKGLLARNYLVMRQKTYLNLLKAKLHLLDEGKIDKEKLAEWQMLIDMVKDLSPTLLKFKKQMLNMIWQANKLSGEVNEIKNMPISEK